MKVNRPKIAPKSPQNKTNTTINSHCSPCKILMVVLVIFENLTVIFSYDDIWANPQNEKGAKI